MISGSLRRSAFLLAIAACSPGSTHSSSALAAQWSEPERIPAVFANTSGASARAESARRAMVASSSTIAAEAGAEILRAGGNAVDAAVATGFALAVAYPEAGNLGGGGYTVIRMADGRTAALDYRETAPAASSRDMYLDSTGRLTGEAIVGRAASGVPGAVAGLVAALEKYGSMPLARVMEPAIRLASEGFIVDETLSSSIAGKESLIRRFGGSSLFLPGGRPPAAGARFVQPGLAETLRLVAQKGASGFYRGKVAAAIVAEMQRECPAGTSSRDRASRGCGLITLGDLAGYQARWRTPVTTTYRAHTILSMPPSSSGGITLGEALNILEPAPVAEFGSAARVHLLASAFQRAFIDRNELLGDADFVSVPAARLLSKEYGAALYGTIDAGRATPTPALVARGREGMETTHYSVVDDAGNAVSTTTTINSLYGSGVFVPGAGFFLNNTMDDFATQPGVQNQFGLVQGEANAIAPRKRGLSAMTPTIVLDPRGEVYMVLGARGGPRIITATAQVILNVIDHRMSLSDAMHAPRIHHQALPDLLRVDRNGFGGEVEARLTAMGHTLEPVNYVGGSVVAIKRVAGGWEGMNDPRARGGGTAGY